MPWLNNRTVPLAFAMVVGGLSLSACATNKYVDEQIAAANTRIGAVDAKATDAIQRADAAAAAAAAAAAVAATAATDAQSANQRLDQLTARVDQVEQRRPGRRPRN
jgi:hypothetical protein